MTNPVPESTVECPRVTVGFERTVKVRDFENAKASIFVQVPTNVGDDLETIAANVKTTFFLAKAAVFEQLGITFEVTPEGFVQELLEKHLGATVEVVEEAAATVRAQNTTPAVTSRSSAKGGTPAPTTKEGLWAELAAEPKRWFDNRDDKRNPKAPDFKRKYSGEGLWLSFKGQSAVPEGITVPDTSEF